MIETQQELSEDKKAQSFTQAEVNYVELSTTPGKACANCRFFNGWDNWCKVVENWPEDVLATGYCDFWHAKTKPGELPVEPLPVVIVGDESKEAEKPTPTPPPAESPAAERKSFAMKMFDWFKSVMGEANKEASTVRQSGFKVSPDGNAWFAWHTGAATDLEGETFPMAVHDAFIERFDKGLVPAPELWFWHMPIPHGKALWIGREDLVVASAGTFDNTPIAELFKAYYRDNPDLEVSQGFTFIKSLKQPDGTYLHYDTFEISPLPPQAKAAYPYTKFNEVLDMMTVTPEKEKQLAEILGSEEAAKEAVAGMGEKSKVLREDGVGFKDSSNNPAIPVIDAEARKSLEDVKNAQEALSKSFTETVAATVKTAVEAATKSLTDALAESQKTVAALNTTVTDMKSQWDEEHKLYAPASKSVVTQLAEKSAEEIEANELREKNKELNKPASVIEQMAQGLGG